MHIQIIERSVMNAKIPKHILHIWGANPDFPLFSRISATNVK
jgi:hypothetical protein